MNPKISAWKWRSGVRNQRKNANFDEFDKVRKGNAAHRQFILDHVAVGLGSAERLFEPADGENLPIEVQDLSWQFQKFRTNKGKEKAENPSISNIERGFSQLPTDVNVGLFEGHTDDGKLKVDY